MIALLFSVYFSSNFGKATIRSISSNNFSSLSYFKYFSYLYASSLHSLIKSLFTYRFGHQFFSLITVIDYNTRPGLQEPQRNKICIPVMASFLVFPTDVLSFKELSSAGRMGFQKPPAVSNSQSRNVRFGLCFKVRAMQEASAGVEGISEPGHLASKTSLYEVLEISPAATSAEVKRAYRKLAMVFHPDHAASTEEKKQNCQIFLRIHNAYVTLSDPHDRAQYDRQVSAGQTWSEMSTGSYRYSCGPVRQSWETDQCW